MVTALVGKKLGMGRIFTEDGRSVPVTLIQVGPCSVVQRKTRDRDGYESVQLGFGAVKESRLTKAALGHFKSKQAAPKRVLREVRLPADVANGAGPEIGQEFRVDLFKAGERVDVSGLSKGKGFAGVQKRHGFKGGPASHGAMFHRAPGSVGSSADPSRVIKGKRLPGHMGHRRVTSLNLEVMTVNVDKDLLVVRGSVPGANGALLEVRKSVKGAR